MKRSLTLILALLLALSMCAVQADNEHAFTPYEETVTITTGKQLVASPNFLEGDSQGDNYMTRAIKDELNIEVKLLWESDEYASKISLCIAADDLPDMFVSPNYITYASLVENEKLADLSEVWQTYATDFTLEVCNSYNTPWTEALTDADGHLYCIASPNYYYDGSSLMWLRQDWMDALGLQTPKTIDELHDVLVAFKDSYNSQLVFQKDPIAGYGSLFSSWGICSALNAYPSIWTENAEGKVEYGSVSAQMKEAVKLLNAWYNEGLIDPEFPTYDTNAVAAKFNAGETGVLFGPWWVSFQLGDSLKLEGCKVAPYNVPADADGKVNLCDPSNYGAQLLVSRECMNPEAVVKMFGMQFEIFGNGGGTEYTAKYNDVTAKTRAANTGWGALFPCGGVNAVKADGVLQANRATHDLLEKGEFQRDDYTTAQKMVSEKAVAYSRGETEDVNGWIYYMGYYVAGDLFQAENVQHIPQTFAQQTESMGELWASLETLEDTTIMAMIVGEKSVDDWDDFVAQWYAQGGDIITEEVNEACGR